MIKQLRMNDDFRPLGPAIPKPAPAAPKSVEIKPGIWQAPDGKLRTDFATGQSVAPAPKVTIGVDLASGVDSTCITVYDLSKELGVKGSVVLLACMRFGQQVTLNQAIDGDLADLVRREIAPLFEVEEVPTPLPVLPNSLGDGWILHDGSKTCPIMFAESGEYEIRWTDGSIDSRGPAWDWRWNHCSDCTLQIEAYRLIP
jgi:hypothetical protein